MNMFRTNCLAVLLFALPAFAQAEPAPAAPAEATEAPPPAVKISPEGRAALKRCRELTADLERLRGKERTDLLAQAAGAFDQVAGSFGSEPAVAARAAYEAAELWRRHGSLPLAEKDYLLAARLDEAVFGQRGWLGAADVQRRLERCDEALASYRKVIALGPSTGRAQSSRLAIARLLAARQQYDDAIAMAQLALECARPGRQVIDAANELALIWIQKGDLDAAGRALGHAEKAVEGVDNGDPVAAERLQKAVELMSARRALQRSLDAKNDAGGDAVRLDADRKKQGGE
jgi:tetratricopeptide (TPR) repeat protein